MLLFGQRPPRYAGVGRSCSIAEVISWAPRRRDSGGVYRGVGGCPVEHLTTFSRVPWREFF